MQSSVVKLRIDQLVQKVFLLVALLSASSIVFIVGFIFIRGIKPFVQPYQTEDGMLFTASLSVFLTSTTWVSNHYGALGILINTVYLVFIAAVISFVISVLTALFIVRIAPVFLKTILKSIVELLAAIPSIVFGLFGMGVICPLVRDLATVFGVQTMGGSSGLSTVLVLIMMMIPTITMICITAMNAVKKTQIEASLALGATKAQTDFKIVLGGAKSGLFTGLILGVGRALGEATAVSMVCGNPMEGPVFDLFATTRTLTSTMMLGLHETSGVDYDIRFSVGVLLIGLIVVTNIGLQRIKRRMERR